jgi:hypothetical protein
MDKNEFIDYLNKITKETNSPLLYHRTKISYLESILKDGALLPLASREKKNYNFGSGIFKGMTYDESLFLGFKYSKIDIEIYDFFNSKDGVYFLFNPYDIDEEKYKNSIFCRGWIFGIFDEEICGKWDSTKDIATNIKRMEEFKEIDEVVFKTPKGIDFKDILSINPSGVMIVIDSNKNEKEFKHLIFKYPQYQWVIINNNMYKNYELIHSTKTLNLEKIIKSVAILPISKSKVESEWLEYYSIDDENLNLYKNSIFTSFVYPSIHKKVKNNISKFKTNYVHIVLDIDRMKNEGLFENSYFCSTWVLNFDEDFCIPYDNKTPLKNQLEKWTQMGCDAIYGPYGTPYNQVVLNSTNGICVRFFKYIIVQDDEYRQELQKKYPYIEFKEKLD